MNYKCQCCGFEQEFKDEEEAFHAGWDVPPHFTEYIGCNICPGVCIVLGLTHDMAHQDWKENGRPEIFNDRCVADKHWLTRQKKEN